MNIPKRYKLHMQLILLSFFQDGKKMVLIYTNLKYLECINFMRINPSYLMHTRNESNLHVQVEYQWNMKTEDATLNTRHYMLICEVTMQGRK